MLALNALHILSLRWGAPRRGPQSWPRLLRAEVFKLCSLTTLDRCDTAGPAKGCFLRFPLDFQKHKNRHGMPRRAALLRVIGES